MRHVMLSSSANLVIIIFYLFIYLFLLLVSNCPRNDVSLIQATTTLDVASLAYNSQKNPFTTDLSLVKGQQVQIENQ